MTRTIFFDMDGTIADLYGVEGWLDDLINKRTRPYENAKPLINLQALARVLNRLVKEGYKVEIISWLAKNSTTEYDEEVRKAKMGWIKKHLATVKFEAINIVEYGTPKQLFIHTHTDILFDDEEKNRENWTGEAHNVNNIIGTLKKL